MSTVTTTAAVAEKSDVVYLRGMWIGLALLNCFYLNVCIYEHVYGWIAGVDSFAPSLQPDWFSILL